MKWIVSFSIILGLISAAATETRAEEKLVLTGSSSIAPIANEIAKSYEADHPNVRVEVQSGGSSRGVSDCRTGAADIGMVSRALKPEEGDLTPHLLALDGVAFIVNRQNPASTLTRDHAIQIYTGKLATWKGLGGPDEEITVVSKAEGRSTLELFLGYTGLKADQVQADLIIGENIEGIKAVDLDPNAIAYVSIGTALSSESEGARIKLLEQDGVSPTLDAVRSGHFPIIRELNFVTLKSSPLADDFISYALSKKVVPILEAAHVIPVAD